MRKLVALIFMTLVVTALGVSPASAGSPHFINSAFDVSRDGNSLTVENSGGSDNGQIWVSPPNPPEVIAVDIVANPGNTPIFQYFTGPNDAVSPNTLLPVTPATPCSNVMTDADRARIGRIVITLTAEGRVGSQVFRRTLRSDARPRNVP